jgi:hypothetical protein
MNSPSNTKFLEQRKAKCKSRRSDRNDFAVWMGTVVASPVNYADLPLRADNKIDPSRVAAGFFSRSASTGVTASVQADLYAQTDSSGASFVPQMALTMPAGER